MVYIQMCLRMPQTCEYNVEECLVRTRIESQTSIVLTGGHNYSPPMNNIHATECVALLLQQFGRLLYIIQNTEGHCVDS